MRGAIVGFEIAVDRLEGKIKLSQNRSPEDRRGVVAALEAQIRKTTVPVELLPDSIGRYPQEIPRGDAGMNLIDKKG
jgi:hypothetical protein